ncbi:hypothetical protein FOZ63_000453 [Perkinsus olseni]|uniref:LITAF domain-containing protein n=1 Tax=Perkinsus olseni TaxID=32597 RepID=A0A7J6TDF9_PEROL|nr:hypothetical protein FOZ63_000453 [Perkinsus olseni]
MATGSYGTEPLAPVATPALGHSPDLVPCGHCGHEGLTIVEHRNSCGTYICSCLLLLLFFPVFWVPFFCHNCQEANHVCAACGEQVGKKVFITE